MKIHAIDTFSYKTANIREHITGAADNFTDNTPGALDESKS